MKRGWMIILLLSLGLNIGLGLNLLRRPSVAAPPGKAPVAVSPVADEPPDSAQVERFMRRRLDRMSDELSLDDRQRNQLWTLHQDAGREVFGRRRAMANARWQLHEAYAAPESDPVVIHAAVRRIGLTQSDLDSMIVEVMMREREILTPDQRRHYHSLFSFGPERHPRRLLHDRHKENRQGRRQVH